MNTPRILTFVLTIAPAALCAMTLANGCEKKTEPISTRTDTAPANTRTDTAPMTNRADTTRPITPTAPDNTAVNKADASGNTKTPMDQSESIGDIRITAAIRRAILDDKSMSINATNCKIITDKSGMVTLRGPVNSRAELESIEAKARGVAGVTKVDNLLEVKPN